MTDPQVRPCVFLKSLPPQVRFPWGDPWIADRVEVIDQYQLSPGILEGRKAILVTMHQDLRWLERNRLLLESFTARGGTLVVQGQAAYRYHEALSIYEPFPRPGLADYPVTRLRSHPVFDGLDFDLLNLRKGVAGFYTRGSNPPPDGATVITAMAEGRVPVDWMLPWGKGGLLVHSGNDVWTTFEDPEANLDFARRLIAWALAPDFSPGHRLSMPEEEGALP